MSFMGNIIFMVIIGNSKLACISLWDKRLKTENADTLQFKYYFYYYYYYYYL